MRAAYLPDWLYGWCPPSWWPNRPRDFYSYTLNVLPVNANNEVIRSVVFSKRFHSLVFGGTALVTDLSDANIVQPTGGTPPLKLVRLANPAGNETFTGGQQGGYVPIENVFGVEGYGNNVGPRAYTGSQAAIWPIPIAMARGSELQVGVINMNLGGNQNVRITFYVALIEPKRKAA
jgi:hypothetical protein